MNVASWILWGFVSTTAMTTIEGIAQGLRITRMSLPLLLGTIFTPDRDRARLYGSLLHFANGSWISLVYVLIFESLGHASWWIGAVLGIVHAAFILTVVLPVFPGIHPRMASEHHGPTATRYFEPPGFMALNYGVRTPLSTFISHLTFGAVLGGFYHLHG